MSYLQQWARGLVSASVVAALARQLGEKTPQKKVIEFVCGVVMLALLFSPVLNADRQILSGALSSYRKTAAELTGDMEERENELLRTYIEQKCGAYILDEADALGMEQTEATVRAKWRGESWIPWEAYIQSICSAEQRARLISIIDSELGIPVERQNWNE